MKVHGTIMLTERQLRDIVAEAASKVLSDSIKRNTIVLYHGGNENETPQEYSTYWLTNSKTLALDYALKNDWPCVYRVTIDETKLNSRNCFEHYDPYFDNAYCLGLVYLDPIVSIEALSEEEMDAIEYDSII